MCNVVSIALLGFLSLINTHQGQKSMLNHKEHILKICILKIGEGTFLLMSYYALLAKGIRNSLRYTFLGELPFWVTPTYHIPLHMSWLLVANQYVPVMLPSDTELEALSCLVTFGMIPHNHFCPVWGLWPISMHKWRFFTLRMPVWPSLYRVFHKSGAIGELCYLAKYGEI
jgi:hypothetical protein